MLGSCFIPCNLSLFAFLRYLLDSLAYNLLNMKYIILFLLLFCMACENKPKERGYITVSYNTDLSEFKGKVVSQMFPESNGYGVTVIFTDSTRVTVSTCSCSLFIYK
jgi:hypothetical protein